MGQQHKRPKKCFNVRTCRPSSFVSCKGTLCTAASAEAMSEDGRQVTPCMCGMLKSPGEAEWKFLFGWQREL